MTQICAQRHKVATEGILFPSKSSDKVYKVTAFRPNEFPFCSCPAYIFSRSKEAKKEGVHQNTIPGSCKHLTQVLDSACDWRQETDEQYRFDGLCPKCHGPLVEEGDYALPDDPVHAVDDLRALLADMKGEEAPAPLPKPTPHTVEFSKIVSYRVQVDAIDPDAAAAIVNADPASWEGTVWEIATEHTTATATAGELPTKKPRKAPAKKAAASRSRKVDVTGLVQGARQ